MPEESEEGVASRASSGGDAFYTEWFSSEMTFWLKEEMALQELSRRLTTVITHVGNEAFNIFPLRPTDGGWARSFWAPVHLLPSPAAETQRPLREGRRGRGPCAPASRPRCLGGRCGRLAVGIPGARPSGPWVPHVWRGWARPGEVPPSGSRQVC